MGQTIICTICSKKKNEDPELIKALLRYTGTHVIKVEMIAREENLPLFFLSGKMGLIGSEDLIPFYDHPLHSHQVMNLAERLTHQLLIQDIEIVKFYMKSKIPWIPYQAALTRACENSETELEVYKLEHDD